MSLEQHGINLVRVTAACIKKKSWRIHKIKPVPWQRHLDKWSGDMSHISDVDSLITDICLSLLTLISDLIRGLGEYQMPLSLMAA